MELRGCVIKQGGSREAVNIKEFVFGVLIKQGRQVLSCAISVLPVTASSPCLPQIMREAEL